jgi:hypothetical protein
MAGIQALVNQQTNQIWGNPNPIYYQIAQNEYGVGWRNLPRRQLQFQRQRWSGQRMRFQRRNPGRHRPGMHG